MAEKRVQESPVRNFKSVREATISPRDVDILELSDGQGQVFGRFVRFTVAMPGYHPSIKELSFMVSGGKEAEDLASQYNSGSGRIKVYDYSASDATRNVARVFSSEADLDGVFALPCPSPTPQS